MPRTLIVGDVHGCRAELSALLAKAAFTPGDRLVMVGDLVVRGPDSAGTLDLLISLGARSVRGNHEDRLLRLRDRREPPKRGSLPPCEPPKRGSRPVDAQRAAMAALTDRHWAFLAGLPLWLDLPEHGVRVVHAGVVPGVPIERQSPRALMTMRCLDASGEPVEKRGGALWGAAYRDGPHVVFGHNAQQDPQIHPRATGLDTGCVYGGHLTALVLDEGASPPPARDRAAALVSVRSLRAYADD